MYNNYAFNKISSSHILRHPCWSCRTFLLCIGILNGDSIWEITGAFFSLVVNPFFAVIFPIGLVVFIIPELDSGVAVIVGYILYTIIFLLGMFVKSRKVFLFT